MYNADVISMPDKWEYPWYAAWDLAFHVLALTLVDADFGKQQLKLMLQRALHAPQRPDARLRVELRRRQSARACLVATIFTYRLEKAQTGGGDTEWLKSCFHKLLLNFTWWVNRKDRTGRNVFEGGFLGLDNIGVVRPQCAAADRRAPGAIRRHRVDGALQPEHDGNRRGAGDDRIRATRRWSLKFIEHFMWIASAMNGLGDGTGMWDEEDGFFYDVLRLPDGSAQRLKVRSMVGLLPLCAGTTLEAEQCEQYPEMQERFAWFLSARPELSRLDA